MRWDEEDSDSEGKADVKLRATVWGSICKIEREMVRIQHYQAGERKRRCKQSARESSSEKRKEKIVGKRKRKSV